MATEVLWRHEGGPPWPNFQAVTTYLETVGLAPDQVHAIEVIRVEPSRRPRVRVELLGVDLPPGFDKESA